MNSYDYGFIQREYSERIDGSKQVFLAREVRGDAGKTGTDLPVFEQMWAALGRYLTGQSKAEMINS